MIVLKYVYSKTKKKNLLQEDIEKVNKNHTNHKIENLSHNITRKHIEKVYLHKISILII